MRVFQKCSQTTPKFGERDPKIGERDPKILLRDFDYANESPTVGPDDSNGLDLSVLFDALSSQLYGPPSSIYTALLSISHIRAYDGRQKWKSLCFLVDVSASFLSPNFCFFCFSSLSLLRNLGCDVAGKTELGEKESDRWISYQYMGSVLQTSPAAVGEVSVEEIRSASAISDLYPPSIHGGLVSSPDPYPNEQAVVFQGGVGGQGMSGNTFREFGRAADKYLLLQTGWSRQNYYCLRQTLDEVEIRELLIDHVGHRCCWGSRPARKWKIHAVEDCNVYMGTLETFIEEREMIREIAPYLGGKIDGHDNGPEPGIWELDLRSEFPLLFVQHKETRAKIPHSDTILRCSDCKGRGEIACPTCNAGPEPGFYKENQMIQCPLCYGRGLIAHRDGSDTFCTNCGGKGKLPCATCGSRGLMKCGKCGGEGSLVTHNVAVVRWRTLLRRKVSASSGAASVPDEVFHRAKGVQLCNTQAYQCTPAYFADSFILNKFSSDVIADRPPVPPTARVICERHAISVVPVTRITMVHRNRSFSFYIVGLSQDIYIKDYPSSFCWGLCPCLNWLGIYR
ncbi:hypothetical protein ACLOJK_030185 [Asimina triloba]